MFPWKKIVSPTDFSEGSLEALTRATELALHFQAELYLTHVLPTHPGAPEWEPEADVIGAERLLSSEADNKLRKAIDPLTAKGIRAHAAVVHGNAAEEIVRVAKAEDADLIVIATHGTTGWRHLAFGSVAEEVVRLASCPVLIVRIGAASQSL